MDSIDRKIAQMKNILGDLNDKNSKAKAQEEILLRQLKEEFEVVNLEEGFELYDQLIDEKNEIQKKVANQTDSLYNALISEGLIDDTQ